MLQFILGFAAGASLSGIIAALVAHRTAQRARKALKANDLLEFLYY